MMTNKEKFLKLVSGKDTETMKQNKLRIANRQWIRASQDVAFKVLEKLDELGWSQKDLAHKMGVTPQYINKIVKGQENLTIETQMKIQTVLDIPILASYYDEQEYANEEVSETFTNTVPFENKEQPIISEFCCSSKSIYIEYNKESNDYSYKKIG